MKGFSMAKVILRLPLYLLRFHVPNLIYFSIFIGDYQYDIYRLMRNLVREGTDWKNFYPKTNLYWIHYLVYQLLRTTGAIKYKTSHQSRIIRKDFQNFLNRIMKAERVEELLFDPFFYEIIERKSFDENTTANLFSQLSL
jgi:hypothetical protein